MSDEWRNEMRKLFTVLSGLTLLVVVGAANAESNKNSVTGVVQQLNAAKSTIVLKDGTKLTLAEGISMRDIKPGHEVTVTYEMKGNEKIGTSVASEYYFLTE
jgi:streptogramin lyase